MTNATLRAIPRGAVLELGAALGKSNVISSVEDLIVFEYDGTIEKGQPQVVVFPSSAQDVAAAVKVARKYDLPVVPRGAGTGLSGGAVAAGGGGPIALTRMKRGVEGGGGKPTPPVEPGPVNPELNKNGAQHRAYYRPPPAP